MTAALAVRAGLPGELTANGYTLPPDLSLEEWGADQIGRCGKIVDSKSPSRADNTLGEHPEVTRMQPDPTMPFDIPEGYVLPPPIDLGALGVIQRPPVPTPATIERIRAEIFADKDLTPAQRGWILTEARVPAARTPSGHRIYFAQAPDGGRIKIGCSKRPRTRLGEIRGTSGIDVRLLGTMAGDFATEKELHRQFAGERLPTTKTKLGDWFFPSPRLKAFIRDNTELRRADEYEYLHNKRNRKVGR